MKPLPDNIEIRGGWSILIRWRDAPGYYLRPERHATRSECIKEYDRVRSPGAYAKHRRKGEARAIKIAVVPAEWVEDLTDD